MKLLKTLLSITSAATVAACGETKTSAKYDTVIIDFQGSIDGEVFAGGTAKNYSIQLGSQRFIDGFEDQLIGYKKGDAVEVNVKFPDNYHAEALAGKEAKFEVKIKDIKKETATQRVI